MILALLLAATSASAPAAAGPAATAPAAPAACPATPTPPGAPWAAWTDPAETGTALTIGHPLEAGLASAAGRHAGELSLTIARAGTYRIALSGPGWIDVLAAGATMPSTGHAHGEPCSGIRKIVAFALQPGTYRVSLAQSPAPRLRVMVIAD